MVASKNQTFIKNAISYFNRYGCYVGVRHVDAYPVGVKELEQMLDS